MANDERPVRIMHKNGEGIVPHTARTGVPYSSNDVASDPYYFPFSQEIRSEQAGAISLHGDRLAVINQETNIQGRFSPATAQLLQESAQAEMLLKILNLRAAETPRPGREFPTLWSPVRHGWDLREFSRTNSQARQGIARAGRAWLAPRPVVRGPS